jgi:hypothetical protein
LAGVAAASTSSSAAAAAERAERSGAVALPKSGAAGECSVRVSPVAAGYNELDPELDRDM